MAVQLMSPGTVARPKSGPECRVWERFACDLKTSCQPIAARADKDLQWPGFIRDISLGGVGLVLNRRFERGAGLAIEIPESESYPGDTLLVKVMRVTPLPDGLWLLGCAFAGQLSDDSLMALLRLGQAQQTQDEIDLGAPPEPGPQGSSVIRGAGRSHFVLSRVDFVGTTNEGGVGSVPVRRLYLAGSWPLPEGTVLKVRAARGAGGVGGVTIRVTGCAFDGNRWKVSYTFVEKPPAAWLALLGHNGH